jgi:FkbM family methyltransferase
MLEAAMLSAPIQTARSLGETLRLLWQHPLAARDRVAAVRRWARWQIGSRLVGGSAIVPFVDETVLSVRRGMTGATGNVYVGLHEFADMGFVAHFLREGDRFLDVGANVGSYTVLAAGARRADTIAIEPVPGTFRDLMTNVRLNGLESRAKALNVGLAASPGTLRFTTSLDTTNHVVAGGGEEADTTEVPVTTLDDVVGACPPVLVKIDVEGFESQVLAGARKTLASPETQALIVELNGAANRYGLDVRETRREIEALGFRPFAYDPLSRSLTPWNPTELDGNYLFLRDPAATERRVRTAPPIRVLGGFVL